jgi:oligoribonuclease (3'-5' exoribonuclease)
MQYISADIETTGLDPETCDILEVAAVIDNTEVNMPIDELPAFQALVHAKNVRGEPFALQMNAAILKEIALAKIENDYDCDVVLENKLPCNFVGKIVTREYISLSLENWLKSYGINTNNVVVAGKNFASFDKLFLMKLPHWKIKFHYRSIDPGMLYWRFNDQEVPGMTTCLKRAEFPHDVKHRALDDAKDVIRLIRHHFFHEMG